MVNILLADDEPLFAMTTAQFLEENGFHVLCREDGEQAEADMANNRIDLVIVDLDMPGNRKLEMLNHCRRHHQHTPLIVVTGRPSLPTAIEGIRLGIHDYFLKPLDLDDLLHSIRRAIPATTSIQNDVNPFAEILGTSPAIRELKRMAERIAGSQATVLIHGESGTGKELLARAIHRRSRRSHGPFITVDCTSLPETLMESALFGHRKGAFTGADRSREGLIALAHGGTLFLDEIGEMPLPLQAKLLRVLQFGTFLPLGAEVEEKVDIRIVAATNRNLWQEVQKGSFRLDLFYRLSVLEIVTPPLRERLEDVPLLANHFVEEIARRDHLPSRTLSDDALATLLTHHWPGNVRELQNTLERSVCLARSWVISSADIHLCRVSHLAEASPDSQVNLGADPNQSLQGFREASEREYFSSLLRRHGGNIASAAREANLSRQGLHKALARLGLLARDYRP